MITFKRFFTVMVVFMVVSLTSASLWAQDKTVSTKKERNHITKGNKFYEEEKFKDALKEYQEALEENPSSIVGKYNLGLTEIRIGSNPNDTSETAKKILANGMQKMEQVANLGIQRPDLASKANYNLGNVAFNSEDYQKAINYYKQSLRLNPEDDSARRNLRIAQLKIQNQDQQDQDQNQDQEQEQNQDQEQQDQQDQDQKQDQDQEQNQDEEQNQDQQNEQPQSMNPQTAEQILNAIENKENQTRARVAGQNAEKSRQRNKNKKNW